MTNLLRSDGPIRKINHLSIAGNLNVISQYKISSSIQCAKTNAHRLFIAGVSALSQTVGKCGIILQLPK